MLFTNPPLESLLLMGGRRSWKKSHVNEASAQPKELPESPLSSLSYFQVDRPLK